MSIAFNGEVDWWSDLQPGEARWDRPLTLNELDMLNVGYDPTEVAPDNLLAYRQSSIGMTEVSWFIQDPPS